jgi:hypothetical protein
VLDFIHHSGFFNVCCQMPRILPDVQNNKHWLLPMDNYGGSYAALIKIMVSRRSYKARNSDAKHSQLPTSKI